MTVPTTLRKVQVSPVQEIDEGFHDSSSNSQSYSRDAHNVRSTLAYPSLYVSPRDHRSYSTPEIHKVVDLFTVEMENSEEFLKKNMAGELFGSNAYGLKKKGFPAFHPDSFFSSMRPLLIIFQLFGLLPVSGLLASNHEQLRFQWKHWKVAYAAVTLLAVLVLFIFSLLLCFRQGFSYDRSAPLVFYLSGAAGILLFLDLARHWATLNRQFMQTDLILLDYGYPKNQGRKFYLLTLMFSLFAVVEHSLSKVVSIMKSLPCKEDGPVFRFFLDQYYAIFSVVEYNAFMAIFALCFNFIATVCWNLTDLFLGLMAMALSSRLQLINHQLASVHGKEKPSSYWRKVREEYNALSVLTKQVDHSIQRIMLLSLGNNLFFICSQLLKSLKQQSSAHQVVYFFWSFGFLIMRTAFVTLSAAGVYDQSRESKTVLYSVPHESFCLEVRRFLTQLSTDDLVLTGCRFFSVTRGLILTIAGTVVTYEIVLVQFKTDTGDDDWAHNTTRCMPINYI